MCLGFPGQIVSISGTSAVMDCWGTRKNRPIRALRKRFCRDFVIEHDGVIVRLIPPEDVEDTLALYETILAETLVPA